ELVLSPDNYHNIYKFINHACCPNAVMTLLNTDRTYWFENGMHARQTIYPGDEIEVDYGENYHATMCR
ncbi:hypothetical protein PENTCL1PPCAC_898, partial [Pristionchus entomophagus]